MVAALTRAVHAGESAAASVRQAYDCGRFLAYVCRRLSADSEAVSLFDNTSPGSCRFRSVRASADALGRRSRFLLSAPNTRLRSARGTPMVDGGMRSWVIA